jgi:hypothetical protein
MECFKKLLLITLLSVTGLSLNATTFTLKALDGWDIYVAGNYRYGPSIIRNANGSIDAWFAAAGDNFTDGEEGRFYNTSNTTHSAAKINANGTVAQKITYPYDFYSIDVCCPTYGKTGESATLSVYKWDTNYATTMAGKPLYQHRYTNFTDNQWLSCYYDSTAEYDTNVHFPAGSYLWVLSDATDNAGVWYYMGTNSLTNYIPSTSSLQSISYSGSNSTNYSYEAKITYNYGQYTSTFFWDQASYQRSTDEGKTWSKEVMSLRPTYGSRDAFSCCDPGVAKWGGYYYIGYTSTENSEGLNNHVYVGRSKSQKGPWQKWNGEGWGGTLVAPVITYTGDATKWGAGEPSIVVKNDSVFFYYSWDDGNVTTRLSVASANDPNWPANLTPMGTVIDKSAISGADHCDVKYVDAYNEFVAFHTASRMGDAAYLNYWESSDGIHFVNMGRVAGPTSAGLHNCGLSGDTIGHIDITKQQFVGYAYGQNWGQWNTRLHPLQFYAAGVETVNSDNAITVSGDVVSVAKTSDITVFNIEGKVIASVKNANSVKLSGKGVYIVKAAAGNTVKVKKVII